MLQIESPSRRSPPTTSHPRPTEESLPSCRAAAPGNEDLRALNPLEQRRHKKAKDEYLVQQALQPEFEEAEAQPEDIEDLAEAYRIRFEADTHDMSLEEMLHFFGVPEVSRVAIHKHLYPSKGSSNASQVVPPVPTPFPQSLCGTSLVLNLPCAWTLSPSPSHEAKRGTGLLCSAVDPAALKHRVLVDPDSQADTCFSLASHLAAAA